MQGHCYRNHALYRETYSYVKACFDCVCWPGPVFYSLPASWGASADSHGRSPCRNHPILKAIPRKDLTWPIEPPPPTPPPNPAIFHMPTPETQLNKEVTHLRRPMPVYLRMCGRVGQSLVVKSSASISLGILSRHGGGLHPICYVRARSWGVGMKAELGCPPGRTLDTYCTKLGSGSIGWEAWRGPANSLLGGKPGKSLFYPMSEPELIVLALGEENYYENDPFATKLSVIGATGPPYRGLHLELFSGFFHWCSSCFTLWDDGYEIIVCSIRPWITHTWDFQAIGRLLFVNAAIEIVVMIPYLSKKRSDYLGAGGWKKPIRNVSWYTSKWLNIGMILEPS